MSDDNGKRLRINQKHICMAAISLVFSCTCVAADTYSELSMPDKSGFMWGQVYQHTKAACGTLPQDLEDDYAKAIRFLSEASPEFGPTFKDGLKPSLKKEPPKSAEEMEDVCVKGQTGLRNQVKLARYWFTEKW